VIGIGVDTTGSTPIPVNGANRPLALEKKWQDNLAAHAWLWKDHTGAEEAAAITAIARDHWGRDQGGRTDSRRLPAGGTGSVTSRIVG